MTIALIVVVFFGIRVAGGWDVVVANAKAIPGYLSMTHTGNVVTKEMGDYSLLTICSTLAWGLGYFGMPHILLRFMAIRDEKEITLSRRIASVWVVISMAVAILIGIVGYAMSMTGRIPSYEDSSGAERIIIATAQLLSEHGVASALLAGVILAGILACTMSTADSQLLAASSDFSQNFLVDVLQCKLSAKKKIAAARITVIVIALIAIFIARNPSSSVFGIVSFAWAGFGASFGPVMLFSLFWRRTNRNGAVAGMLTGGIMVFVWKYLVRPLGGAFDIYELLPAFLLASLMIWIVSLATEPPSQEIQQEFDEVANVKTL
jgi:sodium/proline symporter